MEYGILNNRKRAIIALVHSIVFLAIAMMGLQSPPKTGLFTGQGTLFTPGRVATFFVYLIVTSVLLILIRYSRCRHERAYFAFCSRACRRRLAARSLWRYPIPHVGAVARLLLLGVAVIVGFAILQVHSQPQAIPES